MRRGRREWPLTSGILIGIGETRAERLSALSTLGGVLHGLGLDIDTAADLYAAISAGHLMQIAHD